MPDTITIKGKQYVPCYAALTYAEFWAAEGVQAAGDSSSSDQRDSCTEREEYDLGAFDAVSRATTNHGLHRGNFQGSIVLHADNGQDYTLDHWDGKATMVLSDGTQAAFSKGTLTFGEGDTATSAKMTGYDNIGLRYVPVAVPVDDWEAFAAAYAVKTNGEQLAGGYAEVKLSSYTAEARIDADTNGLKLASKNADGTFSFAARQTGASTGLASMTMKGGTRTEPEAIDTTQLKQVDKDAIDLKIQRDTTYGDFIRVDLLGDYGDLGATMYAAKWTYYGGDASRSKPLATYGTKFAADNWMHKSNGIQLGLTLSKRCTLPAGTNGDGFWSVTVYAMGRSDTTFDIQVSPDDLRIPATQADLSATQQKAAGVKKYVTDAAYTAESRKVVGELVAAAERATLGTWEPYKRDFVSLNSAIDEAVAGLVKVPSSTTDAAKPGSEAGAAKPGTEGATKPTVNAPANTSVSLAKATVSGLKAWAYTGKALKPAVTVKLNGKTLKVGRDYTVRYRSNKAIGTARVVVTGVGSYTGTITKTFSINPAKQKISKVSKAKRSFVVTWKKDKKATGYQVQYSLKKNFKKAVTKTVKKSAAKLKVTKLKSGKTYYVHVRTMAKVKGKTYYGSWSAAKKVKVK